MGEIAKKAEAADAENHAEEKQQGVPFGTGDVVKNIESLHVAGFGLRARRAGALEVIAEELEQGEAGHHADERRQIQEIVEGYRQQQHDHEQRRSEEHTSELQSLMRTSYAVFCLKKTKKTK